MRCGITIAVEVLDALWREVGGHKLHSTRKLVVKVREIMMGVGNRVASAIMLTFPSEPCPHADFSK